ncbi:MAG: hydrogenase maturation protease [Thermoplasmatota archaeon]
MNKIGVIGIGNPLRGDDGIGIVLLERLQSICEKLPEYIEYIDGGTGGMNLLHVFPKFECIILIDAVNFGGVPGEFKVFSLDEICSKKLNFGSSTHESDFLNIISISKKLHEIPKYFFIFAIQPKDVLFSQCLSEELKQKLDYLVILLESELLMICKKYFDDIETKNQIDR